MKNLQQVNAVSCRINRLLISRSNLQASDSECRCKHVLVLDGVSGIKVQVMFDKMLGSPVKQSKSLTWGLDSLADPSGPLLSYPFPKKDRRIIPWGTSTNGCACLWVNCGRWHDSRKTMTDPSRGVPSTTGIANDVLCHGNSKTVHSLVEASTSLDKGIRQIPRKYKPLQKIMKAPQNLQDL